MVFTYSRPIHTHKVLEALNNNDLAHETDVYAYTCTPKNEGSAQGVEATQKVLYDFTEKSRFRSYTVVDIGKFLPLGPAMINAVNETIKINGKVIIVEDDIVTSKDFLSFMNACLDRYKDSKEIFSVGGYSPALKCFENMSEDVYFVRRACPWGWATWSDRWERYDPVVREYVKTMRNRKTRRSVSRWNTDLPMTLDALFYERGCMDKNWEQQFCYSQYLNDMHVVCPKISKVENIGFDGTGTHEAPEHLRSNFVPEGTEWELCDPIMDKGFQDDYNRTFIFSFRNRMMLRLTNLVHFISPSLYYFIISKLYKNKPDLSEYLNGPSE